VKTQTLLAFDYGLKRIGVAVGQTKSCTATELDTVRAKNGIPEWNHVDKLIKEWEPDTLVIGTPHLTAESNLQKSFKKFGSDMFQRYNLPLLWIDESLSTEAANIELRTSGASTNRKRTMRDRIAARLILETHFNTLHVNQIDTG
jgi:putative Holliday junction resolvase